MRGRFMWRIAAFVVAAFVLAVSSGTLLFLLGTAVLGPIGALLLLIPELVLLSLLIGRAARRFAAPVGDLIEAAGRIEAGDYAGRVRERGPREARALARAFNAMSARLAATDDERRRLLADVSHELRTPLTVIQGNLEALLDGVYPADAEHVAPILEEARHLGRLIDDLRTLALAEAGRLELHREPIDLEGLLTDVASGLRSQADEAGIVLTVRAGDLPPIEADPARIRQVVENLLINALRYTPRGGRVELSATAAGEVVEVTVADDGRGIEAGALPHIFDRFARSPDSPGSGLGLPIARNLVAAHGGEMTATSQPGRGTTIRFTLP